MLNKRVYSIVLSMEPDGEILCSVFSHWVGWGDVEHRTELRMPSLVDAKRMKHIYKDNSLKPIEVTSIRSLVRWIAGGGAALINPAVLRQRLPQWLEPRLTAKMADHGFAVIDEGKLGEALRRAPTPAQRLRVMKRDGFRCSLCGRGPETNVDVSLHIHHIIPWGVRGVSSDHNLITLCHTCHIGIVPHHDRDVARTLASKPRNTTRARSSPVDARTKKDPRRGLPPNYFRMPIRWSV